MHSLTEFNLRTIRESDLETLTKIADDLSISEMLTDNFPFPYTESDARSFYELVHDSNNPLWFVITDATDAMIGDICVRPKKGSNYSHVGVLGYWLSKSARRHGVMCGAIERVVEIAFTTYGYLRVEADVFEHNHASMKVLEKAGFQHEGILLKGAQKNGVLRDLHLFARVSVLRP